jgi:beta-lactamase class D
MPRLIHSGTKLLCSCVAAAFVLSTTAFAHTYKEVPELAPIFEAAQVQGTFVLFDPSSDTMFVANEARAKKRFTPASTFKIANSIIGLDVRAVSSVDEVLPYGGKPQRLKQWEQDMNLRDAIKISNVPVYQELARRIGLDQMREGLKKLSYGNMQTGDVVDRFWLDGPLAISAVEQAEFLQRVADGKLPVSSNALRAAREITLLEKTDAYSLHGKTGWYVPEGGGQEIGWWIGWVEREGKVYPFALNIDINANSDAEKRISIARECLAKLGKL